MYRLTDYGSMLRDRARIDAYRRALAAIITPTTTVLDLGTGVGTFSVFAAKLGAARVYAVDSAGVISVAEEVARVNGVADRITFLHASANEVELPERVDVVVSDLSNALPLFEEHIPLLMHAREHLLKPDGVLVPRSARLFCAPIFSAELYAQIIEPWRSVDGIDFSPVETMVLNTPHALKVEPQHLAGEPLCWADLDYATIESPNVSGTVEWQWPAPRVVHGLALWFATLLHDDDGDRRAASRRPTQITYSSGPWSPRSVHATMVLPLLTPQSFDKLRVTLEATLVAGHYVMTWQVNDEPRQSTFLAEPRSSASFGERESSSANIAVPDDATFHISDRVLSRHVGGEMLLLHLASGVYHVLNETGARMWSLLESGHGIESIAAIVASEFDVDVRNAADDVRTLVATLQEEQLIVPAPRSAGRG